MYLTLQKQQLLYQLSNRILSIGLRQADGVVVKDRNSPLLDHYAVFLGWDDNGFPVFIANYPNGGVRVVPHEETIKFLNSMYLARPRCFQGNDYEREQAVNRAISCIGKKGYDLAFTNCEHFINYVQKSSAYSQQTAIASAGTALGGAALLATKNPVTQAVGALAISAGVVSLLVELFGGQSFQR